MQIIQLDIAQHQYTEVIHAKQGDVGRLQRRRKLLCHWRSLGIFGKWLHRGGGADHSDAHKPRRRFHVRHSQ